MKRFTKSLIVVMLILAVGLIMTGCKVTGGGWFEDACSGKKCTFGLTAQADDETGEAKGEFQFNDHAGTKIHAEVTGLWELVPGVAYIFEGETKDEKDVYVEVNDLGEPGLGVGDSIILEYDGGNWAGTLGGGNIQGH